MAGSKGKRDTGKYLQKLYLLLRRLDQNRRQQILAGLSEVQRRELERWMLEYKSTQNHGDQVQALTPDWSRRAGLVPRRRPDGRGLISRRRNGRMRYFAIVVAHRLELRTKEVDCLQVAMKYHSVLVDIKHQISSELGHQRMRSDLDEALAVKLWAKVTAVSERYQVHAEHDLGLYFRAVSPMMGTLLCGPTFHPRTFDVGIAGWQLLQVARGVGSPSSSQELQSAWDRSRRAFAELWAVAGRSPTETARRLDDLERRQSVQDMQKKRAIQQQRRDELKEIRLQKEKARSQRQQQRLEDRVHQLLAKFRKASLRLRCAS